MDCVNWNEKVLFSVQTTKKLIELQVEFEFNNKIPIWSRRATPTTEIRQLNVRLYIHVLYMYCISLFNSSHLYITQWCRLNSCIVLFEEVCYPLYVCVLLISLAFYLQRRHRYAYRNINKPYFATRIQKVLLDIAWYCYIQLNVNFEFCTTFCLALLNLPFIRLICGVKSWHYNGILSSVASSGVENEFEAYVSLLISVHRFQLFNFSIKGFWGNLVLGSRFLVSFIMSLGDFETSLWMEKIAFKSC